MLLFLVKSTMAQYYYKDIVVPAQTMENWRAYKKNNISSVKLVSIEKNGEPTEGFECTQTIAKDFSSINTYTHSATTVSSDLIAFYDANGLLKKTIDTSDTYVSTTEYEYDANGRIASITNTALETDNQVKSSEKHDWQYNQQGVPVSMIKIKNNSDTTYVQFKADEKGNVIEEKPIHNQSPLPVVYYYYNENNQLTDIVRYNLKAQRLLPDYIFEYDANKRLSSMLFVTEGTGDYQKWIYEYDDRGLKSRESCYNKKRELLGRIEYQYK